jgi:hypothetical protein
MTQDRFEPTPENQWPAEPSDEQQLDPRASPTAPAAREAEPPTPPGRQVTGDPPGPSATGAAASEDSRQGLISIDDFARIDLRVAVVLAVERVEGTDRLLQLTIDPAASSGPSSLGSRTSTSPRRSSAGGSSWSPTCSRRGFGAWNRAACCSPPGEESPARSSA